MGLDAVLTGIVSVVNDAINAQGITQPGQVGKGWPVSTELVSVLAQAKREWQVSVYPLPGGRNVTRNRPEYSMVPKPVVTLTASISGNVITFGGTPQAGLNIHVFPDVPKPDAVYVTVAGDTLATIATNVATKVAALSGYTATASGAAVTVGGAKTLRCNIGGSVTAVVGREVGRMQKGVQVSVWAPDDGIRASVSSAIEMGVGQLDSMFFNLSDGSDYSIVHETSSWSDESQSGYSLYVSHHVFKVEFGINQTVSATQVESVIASTTDGSVTNVGYSAGP